MSVSPQTQFIRAGVTCSDTTTTQNKPSQDRLTANPIAIATPNATHPLLNDPTLQSTWAHCAWAAIGCAAMLVSLAKCVVGMVDSHVWLEPMLAGCVGYILADLVFGFYHWAVDNYGDASTPVFRAHIEASQDHHKSPWTITRRQFANNLHAKARAVTFVVLPLDLASNDHVLHGFVSVFAFCVLFIEQFHAWAHCTKSKLPALVVALQDMGVLLSQSQHAAHHRPPYNKSYCLISGVWNKFLDQHKVFEALEMVLYSKTGVRPRSWSEPNLDWTDGTQVPTQV